MSCWVVSVGIAVRGLFWMLVACLVLYICCFGNLWFLLLPVGLGFIVGLDGAATVCLLLRCWLLGGGLSCLVVRLV